MLRLTLLGGFSLEHDGRLLTGRASQNKRLVVLAVLAVAPGQRVSRDKLSALLWPEHDAEHARHQLTSSVYELRHALGGDLIWSVGDDLQLNLELVIADVVAFLAACRDRVWEQAAALYGGPFLDGFHISGSAEFEGWLQLERDRFAAAHATALRALATAAEGAGDAAAAVEWLRRLVAQEPYDSDAALRLVQAAVRKGDPADAVRYARRHAEGLERDLGLEPPPALAPYLRQHATADFENGRAKAALVAVREGTRAPVAASPAVHRWPRRDRRILVVGTLGFVLLAAILVGASLFGMRGRNDLKPRRLAVAPFENRTGDAAFSGLGALTADWITQALTESELLEVADGVAALRPAAHGDALTAEPDAVRLIARSTGAGLVVTGRYYRDEDSLRFVAQVVDARSEQVLRAADPVAAALSAPDLAAERVGRQLLGMLVVLLDPRLADYPPQKPPPSYEAYMEFVAGGRHNRVDEWGEAQPHFARAFQLDSTFYQPLLIWYGAAGIQRNGTSSQQMDSLEALIERLEPKLSTVQWVTFERNRAFRHGDKRAGYATAQRVFQLQSGPASAAGTLAIEAARVHRYREAVTLFRRIDPDSGPGQYWPFRSGAEHALGDFRAQLRSAAALERAHPGLIVPDGLRLTAHAGLGHTAEVRKLAFALTARLAVDERARRDLGNIESLGYPRAVPMPLLMAARELLAHGHPEAARTMAEAALRWCTAQPAADRDSVGFRFVHASLYGMLGRWHDAERVLEGGPPDEKLLQWYRAITAANLGQRARALEIAATLGESREGWDRWRPLASAAVANFYHATVAAALGDRAEAYRRLRILVAAGGDAGEWWLHTEPTLVLYFRDDPEFKRLLEPEG